MRQRGCDIVASAVSAFLFMAVLTATSTILRDVVLRPRPIVRDIRVAGTSALYEVHTPTLLSPTQRDAALYYVDGREGEGRVLPENIRQLDLVDRDGDTQEEKQRKAWQRDRVPPGYGLGLRATHRVILYLSGSIDFAPLWDWNTKAVYISFVARFVAPSTPMNEVVFLDAVMRPVSPPAPILRLAGLRRQEREARRRLEEAAARSGAHASAASAEALLTDDERQALSAYELTLRNPEHDHPSLQIDHLDRVLFLNESFKYFVDAFDAASLPNAMVEVVVRYQVMSYSGWAPVREEPLGHQVKVRMPPGAVPWDGQRRAA